MKRSRYNIFHSLAATVVLLAVVFMQGFANFWRLFMHGIDRPMTPDDILQSFNCTAAIFGTLALALWGSTFLGTAAPREARQNPPGHKAALACAVRWSLVLTPTAIALNLLCAHAIRLFTGIEPASQTLVTCFIDGSYSLAFRIVLAAIVVLGAPLFEEPLFRGIMFRGFATAMPQWAAMTLSGAIFALVHVNAASFLPLCFLGIAFAVLYRRTGTLLAPMLAHALFNAFNMVLLLAFPEVEAW